MVPVVAVVQIEGGSPRLAVGGGDARVVRPAVVHGEVAGAFYRWELRSGAERCREPTQPRRIGDRAAVHEQTESRAAVVARAIPVPHDRHQPPVVGNAVQREVGPVIRGERIHFEQAVGARAQAHEPGDDRVHVPGVKIVLAVIEGVVAVPGAVVGVRRLRDEGHPAESLGPGVHAEQSQIVGLGDIGLMVVVQQVGEGDERLGGRVRPGVATPHAARGRDVELRVVPLDGRGPVGREEVGGVHQVLPGGFVARIGQLELPGDEPDLLAPVRIAGVGPRLVGERTGDDPALLVMGEPVEEEVARRIPQLLLDAAPERRRPLGERAGRRRVAQQRRGPGDRHFVAVEIAVQRGSVPLASRERVRGLAAVDVGLHPVVHAVPSEQGGGRVPVLGHPAPVLGLHVGVQRAQQAGIAQHQERGPHGGAVPVAVAAWLRAGRLEPVAREVCDHTAVLEPTHLVQLVAQRAADGAVRAGPEGPVDEFGEGVAGLRGAVGEVFGDQLPAVVVGRVDGAVGRFEKRDLRCVPVPVAVVEKRPPGELGDGLEDPRPRRRGNGSDPWGRTGGGS